MAGASVSRRSFLIGSSAALVASGGLGTSRLLYSQSASYNPTAFDNASSTQAWAITKSWNGQGTPNDLFNISQAHTDLANNLSQSNFDNQLKSQIASASASQIDPNHLNLAAALQRMQSYEPSFQMSDLEALVSFLWSDPNNTSTGLAQLKQQGLSPLIGANATYFNRLATIAGQANSGGGEIQALIMPKTFRNPKLLASNTLGVNRRTFQPSVYYPNSGRTRAQTISWQRAQQNLPQDGGSTGYTCSDDAAAILAFTVAAATVAVMCYASVVAIPVCTPVVALYLTVGGAGWGFGHAVKCGFPG